MPALNIPKRKKMTAESLYEKATSAGDKLGRAASLGRDMLTPFERRVLGIEHKGPIVHEGAISRPELMKGKASLIQQLRDLVDNPSVVAADNGYSISRILSQTDNPSYYLEYIDKRNLPQKDDAYHHLSFTTKPGSITRGTKEWAPSNEILKAQNIRKNNPFATTNHPENVLSQVRRGLRAVVRPKDNYYNKTLYEMINDL